MLSSLGNKTKSIILFALAALLLCALPAFAAEKIELWNGDIRKGSVSVRMNGTVREMAVDEAVSALGFAPKNDGTSLVVTMSGKKIEFWNGSNIVRSAGTIISFPTPVVTKDGHWWAEGNLLLSAFDRFYKAIGQKAAFRWGNTQAVAAAQPAPQKQTAPKIQPKQSAPVKKTQPAKTQQKAAPKAEPKQKAEAPAKTTAPAPKPRSGRKPIVVIDAGHGGHDPGAVANKIREKDINLRAATQLAKILKEKGADARLTRSTDVYLKLAERTAFANKNNADVFISLHCNSMPKGKSGVAGFEIYIMALPSDKDAMNLAIVENREISGDAHSAAEIQKADKKTQLLLKILGDMQQNDKIGASTELTEVLHKNAKSAGLPMRKVAQAPFFVLRGAGMPAVLVEMGYLTNAAEAKRLNTAAYREKMCRSLADGIMTFIETHRQR
ncbi:MAG TPA: N-acetylmuramoyl-L-alanine amidase [Candidatus Caccocola faecipullorum]|nr:N-acetylmuramoyl-L-alanine amidase [Candidatus Caccocola faecipullorum]